MIQGLSPVLQAALGTLFTWGLTAAGAAMVFVFQSGQRNILDGSLGFAAGVMTAASYWSLLSPAIEMAEQSGAYGEQGQWAFFPVAVGFTLGAMFVWGTDAFMPMLGVHDPTVELAMEETKTSFSSQPDIASVVIGTEADGYMGSRARKRGGGSEPSNGVDGWLNIQEVFPQRAKVSWKRILLLIIAITVHNIPEGLAVGVGFGAVGKSPAATFENARNLAIGIGLQNFPEGIAVSLPLRGAGISVWKSFWYGQLSGMVEPIAGILGALAVAVAEPLLPYALAFAAGAMIYVVVDDIIPEAQTCGNGRLASWGAIVGFVVMMCLDVGLG